MFSLERLKKKISAQKSGPNTFWIKKNLEETFKAQKNFDSKKIGSKKF